MQESEVTELALEKLLKITNFIVRKHWAHVNSYDGFVRFVGEELNDLVLQEYLKLSEKHRNATYYKYTVTKFLHQ